MMITCDDTNFSHSVQLTSDNYQLVQLQFPCYLSTIRHLVLSSLWGSLFLALLRKLSPKRLEKLGVYVVRNCPWAFCHGCSIFFFFKITFGLIWTSPCCSLVQCAGEAVITTWVTTALVVCPPMSCIPNPSLRDCQHESIRLFGSHQWWKGRSLPVTVCEKTSFFTGISLPLSPSVCVCVCVKHIQPHCQGYGQGYGEKNTPGMCLFFW